ncbi:uncharacterized protein FPRN_00187 [Fusarium proliferatum]|nr:uncharacterized protein FPRN_00187 [Fusarium proliferatum]
MATVERWPRQLRFRLGSGEGSSTQISTKEKPGVECPACLRNKSSASIPSVTFCSSANIASKSARLADPKIPPYADGSDFGIGLATPSSRSEPMGFDLPGTELKYFDEPIPDHLKARFFDIKVLYTQPLLDYILKRKKDPGDISMKLKHLGLDSQSMRLHIVIQCEKKIAKRVKKFFTQGHVQEELSPDFKFFVLGKALLRLTDDEAIQVLADSVPNRTWCGTPIRLTRGDKSVMATIGGVVVVETSCMSLVGLTAAHSLKKLHGSPILQPLQDGREVPFSSSSSDFSESEEDSDCESITTEGSVQHVEHLNDKGLDTTTHQNNLAIGTILCNTFNSPMAQNYDWAIIDLSQQAMLPNRVVSEEPHLSGFEEESDLEPFLFPVDNPCVPLPSRQVLVLKQGARPIGKMSLDPSSILISPGSSFVDVYDLAMEHGSSLSPGDSGSWVVDAKTSMLYGHVVSTDAFGEAQVMPISSSLDSIKLHTSATRVFLPNTDEIRMLQETSRIPVSTNPESSLISDAYIHDLGYVADTATIPPSHKRKPFEQPQGTDLQIKRKPNMEHKSDMSMQMDVTTADIVALDREHSVMQQIHPTLSPKEPNILRKPMPTPDLPRKEVRRRNSNSSSSLELTQSSKSCLCSGTSHAGSSRSSSSTLLRCSCCSFRVGSPPPGRPVRGDNDKSALSNFHLSNFKSTASIANGDDPLGSEIGAQWENSQKLHHQMAHSLPKLPKLN